MLAGQGCLLDGVRTVNWPADISGSGRTLAQVWGAEHQHHQQQRRHGANTAVSLPCLSELVTALVTLPTATDKPQPNEQVLLNHVARVLAVCGGAGSPTAANNRASSPQPAEAANQVHTAYSSPGLLHLLLSTHLRLVLEASSDKGTAQAHARAVNAMHLVKALFDQPGLRQLPVLQLLLPCLARPLVKQLVSSSCPTVRLLVLDLLRQMLAGPCRQQLLPELGKEAAIGANGGAFSFE